MAIRIQSTPLTTYKIPSPSGFSLPLYLHHILLLCPCTTDLIYVNQESNFVLAQVVKTSSPECSYSRPLYGCLLCCGSVMRCIIIAKSLLYHPQLMQCTLTSLLISPKQNMNSKHSSNANQGFPEPWRPSLKSVRKGYQEKVYQLPRKPLQGTNQDRCHSNHYGTVLLILSAQEGINEEC